MGRHGGGSRSGGSHRSSSSRSGGGSRGGGSGARTSKTPFKGCYNRTYYDRRGRVHRYYTSNKNFGTKSGWGVGNIVALVFVTLHMCLMLAGMISTSVTLGGRIEGDRSRILILDPVDVLTDQEETEILTLLNQVYEKTGMPVTVCTDDFSWKEHYQSLEVYSEEIYYQIGMDESSMVILFTENDDPDFYDWEYDVYCGDDTERCFSDATFDKFLDNFQKGMAGQKLSEALKYSWNSVMDDLAKTKVDFVIVPIVLFLLFFYGIFYVVILIPVRKQNDAYKYFQANPERLSQAPMTMYSECPSCGASNSEQAEVCPYCGTLLKISDGKVTFVKPN